MALTPLPYEIETHSCPTCWKNGGPGHPRTPFGVTASWAWSVLQSIGTND